MGKNMTRKDYKVIVKGFEESWPTCCMPDEIAIGRVQWARDVRQVGRALAIDNPRFDMTKFEQATGHYEYLHGGVE